MSSPQFLFWYLQSYHYSIIIIQNVHRVVKDAARFFSNVVCPSLWKPNLLWQEITF